MINGKGGFKLKMQQGPFLTSLRPYMVEHGYTDHTIEKLGKEGKKKILVFSPAFVADCLETTIEIGEEYQELFEENGGEELQLVPSLNDYDDWANGLFNIIKGKIN